MTRWAVGAKCGRPASPREAPEFADASYDNLFSISGDPITANGTFISFDVTATGVGSGTVFFDFVDSWGIDAAGEPLDTVLAGEPLAFTVSEDVVIPEASSVLVWSGLIGLGALAHFRRRRCRTRKTVS